jgi:hypothetical protein
MRRSLIVVDDFYSDPQTIRARALGLDFDITGNFPGRNSQNADVQESYARVATAR